jgi:hypothetical protein
MPRSVEELRMDKKVLIGVVAGGVLIGCVVAQRRRSGSTPGASHQTRGLMEDRMRRRMDRMPEDFPPRIVRDYVPAIKADTERILDLLSERSPRSEDSD